MYRALGSFDEPMDPILKPGPPTKPINEALGWLLFLGAVGGFVALMLGLDWILNAY